MVRTVLVTGADGMLGSEVMRCLARDETIRPVGSTLADMDVTNLEQVKNTLLRHRPDHIIHCAAFTFVDLAEKQTLLAYQINAEGTKNLAFFCRELDIELIYLSTDYVFAGDKQTPYVETDRPGPLNAYGMTKLLGEAYTQTLLERHKIVRTSWLNGLGGDYTRNFIETMLRVSETRSTIRWAARRSRSTWRSRL
jgi:dTDP-4-dehydrorhamnose reductase